MTRSPHGPLRVGIGGPVGSGKTALVDRLCKAMRQRYDIAVVTNDIYTQEDAQFLMRSGALPVERIASLYMAIFDGLWRQKALDPDAVPDDLAAEALVLIGDAIKAFGTRKVAARRRR